MAAATVPAEYDYWLFDLDGTLVDASWDYKRELFDKVGDAVGRTFDDEAVITLWDGVGGERNELLRDWGLSPSEFWATFDDLDDPVARAEATTLYPDAERIADIDRPVGIVTHCPGHITDTVLESLDIMDWFETVVACDEQLGYKPDPAPVERAIADLRVTSGRRGILVGDGTADIGAAWNAGIDGAHVERHGPARRGHCVLGDYRVQDLDQLLTRPTTPTAGDD